MRSVMFRGHIIHMIILPTWLDNPSHCPLNAEFRIILTCHHFAIAGPDDILPPEPLTYKRFYSYLSSIVSGRLARATFTSWK